VTQPELTINTTQHPVLPWDMFAARNSNPEEFRSSMWAGQLAAAIALLTWFGLFMTFGGAFLQMWQLVTLVERPLLQDVPPA
jgi:predicted small integral membrane protein